LFRQIREALAGRTPVLPTGRQVLAYVEVLYSATHPPGMREVARVQKVKKYLNYLAVGVEPTGRFLHEVRRVRTESELFRLGSLFLDHDDPMPLEPFALALGERDVMAGCQG
jgi:hypothetical protein